MNTTHTRQGFTQTADFLSLRERMGEAQVRGKEIHKGHPEFISGSTSFVTIQNKEEMLKQVQHDNRRGFTLIELLVVVLIIGILAAVAVPQYQKAVEKSQFTQTIVWLRSIYSMEKLYLLRTGSYDESLAQLDIDWPAGTTLTPNLTRFGRITIPNGPEFQYNSNNNTVQFTYKGNTVQMSVETGNVDCYYMNNSAKKKICQQAQQTGYGCGINACRLISFGGA